MNTGKIVTVKLNRRQAPVSVRRIGPRAFAIFVRRIRTRSLDLYIGPWGVKLRVNRWTKDGYPAFMAEGAR